MTPNALIMKRRYWHRQNDSGMRKELERKELAGVKVMKGEASSMAGVESQTVDAVIAAQVRPTLLLVWAWVTNIGAMCRLFIGTAEKAVLVVSQTVPATC